MASGSDPFLQSVPPLDEVVEGAASERASDYRRALAVLPFGVVIVDQDGDVRYSNTRAEDLLNVDAETFVGQPLGLPLTDRNHEAEVEVRTADGGYRIVQIRTAPLRWRDNDATMVTVHDITDPNSREQALEISHERYALAMAGANDGLWDWDLVAGTFHVNRRWRELLGLDDMPEETDDPSIWLDRTHDGDKTALLDQLGAHLGGRVEFFSVEHRLRNADGDHVWMLARGQAILDEDGEAIRIAGSLTDISERKKLESRLLHEARHDPLTGLANRRLLLERIQETSTRSARSDHWFAVVLLDLDGFKAVNDRHGHDAGDHLLVEVARRLQSRIRPGDVVARLGGDEFALVLTDFGSTPDTLEPIAARLSAALREPYRVEGVDLVVGASIGVAAARADAPAVHELLNIADRGMYRSKQSGSPVITVFEPTD